MKFYTLFLLQNKDKMVLGNTLIFKIPRTHANSTLFQRFKDKAYCTEREKKSSRDRYQVRTVPIFVLVIYLTSVKFHFPQD